MDNFNNGSNEQQLGDMTQPFAPQQPVSDANQQFNQPTGDMNQQFGQPTGDMNQQFGQPMSGMNQQPYGQPQYGQPMGGMNPQFGQPQYGMNQQPYGQPQYGQPPQGGKSPKVKKPLSKGAIGGIIGGGVALIALIVCAIIFLPKLFPTDKEVVVDAFEATFGVEMDGETEDVIGAQEIADKFATTGGVREASFEISTDIDGTTTSMNVGFVESIDVANKLANSTWTVGMDGTNFLNANLVIDETNTYFQLPEMLNGYFSLPNDNIFQALENSELGQAMGIEGMPEFNMADMYFNLATSSTATELNGEYVAIFEKLWDSITYEKQGKAKVDVNGKTVTTKEYFITVPEDNMKETVEDLWDAVIAELAADPAYLEQMGMDAATFESTMGSYSGIFSSLIQGDLVIKVYILDDKIVKLVCADDINIYGTSITYDMYMDMDDENLSGVFDFSVMDESAGVKFDVAGLDSNPSGKITVYAAGEIIDVNFSSTINESGSKTTSDLAYDVVYNGTTYVDGTVKTNVDEAANSVDGNVVVNIMDAGQIEVDYAGGLKDVTKGVAYTIELSKCDILVDGQSMMNMTGKIKLDTSTHEASGIDTSLPVYDVTTLTQADFEDIVALDENATLLDTWLNNNSNLLGGDIYEEPTEPAEPTVPEEPEAEDMILDASNKSVEILGTIAGFDFYMSGSDYIYFESEEWSYIEYALYEGATPEQCVADIYIPDEGVLTQELSQTMEFEGETIYYSYVQDNEFGYNFSSYMFARDLGDGVVLVVSCGVYDEDETFTKEQLVEAIGSQYYKVIQ